MSSRMPLSITAVTSLGLVFAFVLSTGGPLLACPFCNAVSQTLRQEMATMDAVVIATAIDSDLTRNRETGEVRMKIDRVLKGEEFVRAGQVVDAIYYGEVTAGRRFMLSGVDPPRLQWSCLPLSERSEKYVMDVAALPEEDAVARLRFFMGFLQDDDSMLSRDAYDEFAITPYDAVKALAPEMDREGLIEWIQDSETSTDRRRLYFTMLGVCGDEDDVPMLEGLLKSTQKSARSGLDALIACYLTLAGENGLPQVDELFLKNKQASYADTYAAIMAIRFHGTEGDVIPRSALVESLHHVLDRKDLADLVIPDLARWKDWSQIERLTELFVNADPDNNWVRVPVVNYLRACPLPEAEAALEKCKQVDPESVRRANTFFSLPKPTPDASPSTSALPVAVQPLETVASSAERSPPLSAEHSTSAKSVSSSVPLPLPVASGQRTADSGSLAAGQAVPVAMITPVPESMNPWRLVYVMGLALATVMIAQYLLLSGGRHAA